MNENFVEYVIEEEYSDGWRACKNLECRTDKKAKYLFSLHTAQTTMDFLRLSKYVTKRKTIDLQR